MRIAIVSYMLMDLVENAFNDVQLEQSLKKDTISNYVLNTSR